MSQNPGIGSISGSTQPVSTKIPLTALSPTFATVTGTSSQVVASDASRKSLILTNTSSDTIYLAIGTTAVLGSGITLYPAGVWESDEYSYVLGAIDAISSGTSSNLAIQQFH